MRYYGLVGLVDMESKSTKKCQEIKGVIAQHL